MAVTILSVMMDEDEDEDDDDFVCFSESMLFN